MELGLLWYDDDPKKTVERKISEAAERYRQRFGRLPNVCHVHRPLTDNEGALPRWIVLQLPSRDQGAREDLYVTLRVALVPNRAIRPHHFWLSRGTSAYALKERPIEKDR